MSKLTDWLSSKPAEAVEQPIAVEPSMVEAITSSYTTAWVIVAVAVVLMAVTEAGEAFSAGMFILAVTVAALALATPLDPFGAIYDRPLAAAGMVAIYLLAGIASSLFLWWQLLKREASAARQSFDAHGYSVGGWAEYLDKHLTKAAESKAQIGVWITQWPVSIAIYLLKDVVADLGRWVYDKISGVYVAMRARVLASFSERT